MGVTKQHHSCFPMYNPGLAICVQWYLMSSSMVSPIQHTRARIIQNSVCPSLMIARSQTVSEAVDHSTSQDNTISTTDSTDSRKRYRIICLSQDMFLNAAR
jgi:hypothetical protein